MQFILFLCFFWLTSAIAIEPYEFNSSEQENLYKKITKELRCMVCQNQNLADSDVTLAKTLKQQIVQFIKQGQTEQEITQFMAERYGDFILYNPPLRYDTLLLWAAPLLILSISMLVLIIKIRRSGNE